MERMGPCHSGVTALHGTVRPSPRLVGGAELSFSFLVQREDHGKHIHLIFPEGRQRCHFKFSRVGLCRAFWMGTGSTEFQRDV